MSVRKPDWVPATVMAKLVSVAWHEGYQTALPTVRRRSKGEDALHALLNDKDKHE
jgi:hypothetical protein